MGHCPFCSIDRERNQVLMETDRVVVLLSNPRLMPGHTLVIPRRHVDALWRLHPEEQEDLFEAATYFQRRIVERFLPSGGGCDLSTHYRPFMAGTAAEIIYEHAVSAHLHIHLRPRVWQDRLWKQSQQYEGIVFKRLTGAEIAREADDVRAKLGLRPLL